MAVSETKFDGKRFASLAAQLKDAPMEGRVVDILQPVLPEIRELRKSGRTYKEIWQAFVKAGGEASYAHFVKALNELLENRVRARVDARRRGVKPTPPITPVAIARPADVPRASASSRPSQPVVKVPRDRRAELLGTSALDQEQQRVQRRHTS